MRKWIKAAVLAGAGAAAASPVMATVVSVTYTADQSNFPGTPNINTTGTAGNIDGTQGAAPGFYVPLSTANTTTVVDQTFQSGTGGTIGQVAFYSDGTAGTTGSAVTLHLYALGTPGDQSTATASSNTNQGGGDTSTFVNPNLTPTGATGNPDLLATFDPVFDVSATGSFRYITIDLSGAGITLAANTLYDVELQNSSSNNVDALRTGGTDYYTGGEINSGPVTGNRTTSSGAARDGAFAIYYSSTGVPEPASLGLIGLAGAGLLGRRRKD